jgi:hypothetical protein
MRSRNSRAHGLVGRRGVADEAACRGERGFRARTVQRAALGEVPPAAASAAELGDPGLNPRRALAAGTVKKFLARHHSTHCARLRVPLRRGGRKLIMTPEGVAAPARKPSRDETLVKALGRSHRWRRKIESGQAKSITDLAEQKGMTDAYVCRLLPLTCLVPTLWKRSWTGGSRRG